MQPNQEHHSTIGPVPDQSNIGTDMMNDTTLHTRYYPGYDNYIVHDHGEIFSLHINSFLIKRIDNNGYYSVTVNHPKKPSKITMLHRIVAQLFINNPDNHPIVNHIDGNKLNNNVTNLEWVTAKQNVAHAFNTGLNKSYKVPVYQFTLDGQFIAKYDDYKTAGEQIGRPGVDINRMLNSTRRSQVLNGFYWSKTNQFNKVEYVPSEITVQQCDQNTGELIQTFTSKHEVKRKLNIQLLSKHDGTVFRGSKWVFVKVDKPKSYIDTPIINTEEGWKKLDPFIHYRIFNDGRIYSEKTNKFLRQIIRSHYYTISLMVGDTSKHKAIAIHRLVARAFLLNPNNHPIINHIDGDKLNNNVTNLEWCSAQHNVLHAYSLGLNKPSSKVFRRYIPTTNIKCKIGKFDDCGNLMEEFESMTQAEIKTGLSKGILRRICNAAVPIYDGYVWSKY